MKIQPTYRKLLLCLALCLIISDAATANIVLAISQLSNGKTKWQMTTSETPYIVDQYSNTGNYFEGILLPKNAFSFDYSAPFAISFPAPIGRIRNMTTGETIDLTGIRYSSVGGLRFDGGLMSHASGNSFEIIDLPAINVDVLFTSVLTTGSTTYSVSGAWHQVGQVEVAAMPIPEPPKITATVAPPVINLTFAHLIPTREYRIMRSPNLNAWEEAYRFNASASTGSWGEMLATGGKMFYRLEWNE